MLTALLHRIYLILCDTLILCARAREEGQGKGGRKGDKTGGKFKKKGKAAAPARHMATMTLGEGRIDPSL